MARPGDGPDPHDRGVAHASAVNRRNPPYPGPELAALAPPGGLARGRRRDHCRVRGLVAGVAALSLKSWSNFLRVSAIAPPHLP